MIFDNPPARLGQVRRALFFLLDDIDEAVVGLVGCSRNNAKLSDLVLRYMNAVNTLQYFALVQWGIPARICQPLHKLGIASLAEVRFHDKATGETTTVKVEVGTECQRRLVSLLQGASLTPEFTITDRFRLPIRRIVAGARRLTQDELDRALPPSRDRLEAAILDHPGTVNTPVGERIEHDWRGTLGAYDVEKLKNLGWNAAGPCCGATYHDLFHAVKQKFPQLPHSDVSDTLEAYLRRQGASDDDARPALARIKPKCARGVWQEAIDSLLSGKRMCVTIERCTDIMDHPGPRNTSEVTFSLPAATSERTDLVETHPSSAGPGDAASLREAILNTPDAPVGQRACGMPELVLPVNALHRLQSIRRASLKSSGISNAMRDSSLNRLAEEIRQRNAELFRPMAKMKDVFLKAEQFAKATCTTNPSDLVAGTRFQAASSVSWRGLALRAAFKATTTARPLSVSW